MTDSAGARPPHLHGIRVLEQGQLLAVPYATRLLAELGAEVIKIESPLRLDTHRQTTYPDNEPGERFWDRGGTYYSENRGKLGMTLDLRNPGAVRVFRNLVDISDVVMENYTTRVMRGFGLDYDDLVKDRPDIIMLSSTGYGHSGPWANFGAVGPTTEAASGLASLSGYRDGAPVLPDIPYTDYVAAEQAALAVVLALFRRRRTGEGSFIDLAQTEAQTALAGELIMEAENHRGGAAPRGNRHPAMAPHGFFPCAGDDRWIAIAVASDTEWERLQAVMGSPPWSTDAAFGSLAGRKANEDTLEEGVAAWTRTKDAFALMDRLQSFGIAAGVALDGRDLVSNQHLRSRGFFSWLAHPEGTGIGPKPYSGVPWRFALGQRAQPRRAPALGEHNLFVLKQILGYDDKTIASLHQSGALDSRLGDFPRPEPVPLQVLLEQGRIREIDPDYELRSGPG